MKLLFVTLAVIASLVIGHFADYRPDAAFLPSLIFGAPIRYAIPLGENLSLGLRGDPGIAFRFPKGPRSSPRCGTPLETVGTSAPCFAPAEVSTTSVC